MFTHNRKCLHTLAHVHTQLHLFTHTLVHAPGCMSMPHVCTRVFIHVFIPCVHTHVYSMCTQTQCHLNADNAFVVGTVPLDRVLSISLKRIQEPAQLAHSECFVYCLCVLNAYTHIFILLPTTPTFWSLCLHMDTLLYTNTLAYRV